MKCNIPIVSNKSNSVFQKLDSNIFFPKDSIFTPNPNITFHNIPFQNMGIWNTYEDLYNKIIWKDLQYLNAYPIKKNLVEFKPSYNKIKVIFNEELNNQTKQDKLNEEKNDSDKDKNLLERKRKNETMTNLNQSNISNSEIFYPIKKGRKKKKEINKGIHNKFTEDNIIRKIKCHFFNYINEILNKNLVDKKYYFYKLDNFVNENLKKDYNMKLMNLSLKEIYLDSKISNKYKKYGHDINKKLIEKIYSEKNEIEVMKILDKSYIETFNTLIKNNLDNFCNIIIKKEIKNGLSINDSTDYLRDLKKLCENYEKWFEMKRGRREKKPNKVIFSPKNDLI